MKIYQLNDRTNDEKYFLCGHFLTAQDALDKVREIFATEEIWRLGEPSCYHFQELNIVKLVITEFETGILSCKGKTVWKGYFDLYEKNDVRRLEFIEILTLDTK